MKAHGGFGLIRGFVFALLALALFFSSPATADSAPTALTDAPALSADRPLVAPPMPPEFRAIQAGWLRVIYPNGQEERARQLVTVAEDEKALLVKQMGVPVLSEVEFRLSRTPEEMAAITPKEMPPPAYASGVSYGGMHLIAVSLQAPVTFESTDAAEVLRHELAHVALEDATAGHAVPRWFNEGLAVYESGEAVWSRRSVLWQAVLAGTLIPFDELEGQFPEGHADVGVAYAESADFVRFLMRQPEQRRFEALITRVRTGTPFQKALAEAFGTDIRKLESEWRQEVSRRYGLTPFILTSGSALWALALVLFAVGYIRKRREAKAKLLRWEREEAAEDAAMRAAQLARLHPTELHEEPMMRGPEVPVVEHGGSWHTLH